MDLGVVKGPFIPVTMLYMAGLLLGNRWPLPLLLLFGVWSLALIVTVLWRCRSPWCLAASLVLAGWTNLVVRTAVLSPTDLRLILGETARIGTVRGRLLDTPTQRVSSRGEREVRRSLGQLEVTALQTNGDWQPASGAVTVTAPGTLDAGFYGGRIVEVTGVLQRPSGPLADGLFDYRAWLAWQGIHYELVTAGPEDWQLVGLTERPPRRPWSDRFLAWAQRTLAWGLPEEDESLRLLWAMTLGWKTALTEEVSEPFVHTGTMHIFAISGLHIVLITGIFVALLRVLQVPRGACGWVVVPLIWGYTAATGWQASAIRATLMMTVVIAGWALRRPSDLVNSLAAAGFIILVWDPRQLFQASFQLSFFVVLAMALFARPLAEAQKRWLATDPFLPEELVPRWRRWLERPLRWLLVSVGTSTAAWLGSWPWIAHYFHVVTPGGLLANLVIVPLSSLALMSNLGSLICGTWCLRLTELFNHSAWFWMTLMIRVSEWLSALPGTWFNVRSPGLVFTLSYYMLLLGLMIRGFRQGWRWAASVALPVLLLASSIAGGWWSSRHTVTLTVLALRSGAALFVDAPGRHNDLLLDCGDEGSVKNSVGPFLQAQGVNRLACLAVTHGDIRHVGGAETTLKAFRVHRVAVSGAPSRSPSYRRLLHSLDTRPERRAWVHAGDGLAGWTVLHPAQGESHPQADDNVLVLGGTVEQVRVLLLGDLGTAGQAALLRRGTDLRADIVVVGLPARGEPLSEALMAAIQPRLIVLQDAEYPVSERAGPKLIARLERHGIPICSASTDGTITLRLSAGHWEARAMRGRSVTSARPGIARD